MKILEINGLTYSYDSGKNNVLQDISLSFEKGKVYAIMGKSGAGKTTLLSLISGLNTYTKGDIFYNGKDLKTLDKEKYRSQEVGLVFQSYNLIFHLTALENVQLSMDISKIKFKNPKEHALNMLNKVELSQDKTNRKILMLSGGEQQRVAIARALSYSPEVIIADEPTGNLDGQTESQILNILKKLAHEDNKCVIIVTHSDKVSQKSDVIYHLNRSNEIKRHKYI